MAAQKARAGVFFLLSLVLAALGAHAKLNDAASLISWVKANGGVAEVEVADVGNGLRVRVFFCCCFLLVPHAAVAPPRRA